jgi:hypothetical protein
MLTRATTNLIEAVGGHPAVKGGAQGDGPGDPERTRCPREGGSGDLCRSEAVAVRRLETSGLGTTQARHHLRRFVMTRIRFPRRTGRRRTFLGVLTLTAILVVIAVPNAMAVHDLEFQLEGNTADDAAALEDFDWETFFEGPGNINDVFATLPDPAVPGFEVAGAKADHALPDQSTFATGSKDTLSISPGWQCKRSNNVGDKVDILNAYSVAYTDPATSDLILYFGVELSAPNGDANVGMWFLQGEVNCNASTGGNVPFTGGHEDGDVFVVAAFTNGGSQANVTAYEWSGDDDTGGIDPNNTVGGLCGDAVNNPDDIVCAITNDDPVNTPWNSPDKNGGNLDPTEFFEGAINLTETFGAGEDTCFARFLANTRSSQSLGATIFDFAEGELDVCRPSTVLTKTASAQVTYTYRETNDGNTPLTNVSVTDNNCSPLARGADNPGNNDNVLDPDETWVFTCTTTIAGPTATAGVTNTANGSGDDPADRTVRFCTPAELANPPAGVVCDQDERDSVTVTITHG